MPSTASEIDSVPPDVNDDLVGLRTDRRGYGAPRVILEQRPRARGRAP